MKKKLNSIYSAFEKRYGDLGWWPGDTSFEMMVGAILTQNTAWTNVEKAIIALKRENVLTPKGIASIREDRLSGLIRSAGYFRQKAKRLKGFCRFLDKECNSRISVFKKRKAEDLRESLLDVKGVGPETADSMLLYALDKPVFVVDAYAKRIFSRHYLIEESAGYAEVQEIVHDNFPRSLKKLNRFHAYIVETAKRFCKKRKPLCGECPLGRMKRKI